MNMSNFKNGRDTLAIKVRNRHRTKPLYGLEKVPVEALLKLALEQVGEQESYIEELEEKIRRQEVEYSIKRKEEILALNNEIYKEAMIESRKSYDVQRLTSIVAKQKKKIKELRDSRKELIQEIVRLKKLREDVHE